MRAVAVFWVVQAVFAIYLSLVIADILISAPPGPAGVTAAIAAVALPAAVWAAVDAAIWYVTRKRRMQDRRQP